MAFAIAIDVKLLADHNDAIAGMMIAPAMAALRFIEHDKGRELIHRVEL
jgi:hypothetical protein